MKAVMYHKKYFDELQKGWTVLARRLLNDIAFRTETALYIGFPINLLYAAVQLVFGICCHTLWSGALAVYYILLAVMRFLLVGYMNRHIVGQNIVSEWKQYRRCGVLLLFMTPFFASILILVVHKNGGAQYPGLMIYLMALYTLGMIISSIINVVKFRSYGSPVMSAAKIINLIAALMTLLSLETAMLSRFDRAEDPVFHQGMLGTTGGAVCVFVLGIAVGMIVRATKQLKKKTPANV